MQHQLTQTNKNTMKTIKNLPATQTNFINQFDGSLESVLNFKDLATVLNPSFCSHYHFISGTCDEDTITTKHTDGSTSYWGTQTEEQMDNAYELAKEVREFILSHNPTKLEVLANYSIDLMKKFNKKVERVKNNASFIIKNQIIVVKGLKLV